MSATNLKALICVNRAIYGAAEITNPTEASLRLVRAGIYNEAPAGAMAGREIEIQILRSGVIIMGLVGHMDPDALEMDVSIRRISKPAAWQEICDAV